MISKELTFGDFKKCINDINNSLIVKNQRCFRSEKHKVFTVKAKVLKCVKMTIKKFKMI